VSLCTFEYSLNFYLATRRNVDKIYRIRTSKLIILPFDCKYLLYLQILTFELLWLGCME